MTLNDHDARAQRVVRAMERFVGTFVQRTDSEYATNVLYDNEPIRATRLGDEYGQKPERFIVEELITEIADALEYDYRSQPRGFDGLDGRFPDFTVMNADATVIGEVKKPNTVKQAWSESFEYHQMAETRPVVGIATDGFSWIMHTADEGERPEYENHVSLRRVLKNLARERDSERAPRQPRRKLRNQCQQFVESFGIEQL